jgi:hypothetical protein
MDDAVVLLQIRGLFWCRAALEIIRRRDEECRSTLTSNTGIMPVVSYAPQPDISNEAELSRFPYPADCFCGGALEHQNVKAQHHGRMPSPMADRAFCCVILAQSEHFGFALTVAAHTQSAEIVSRLTISVGRGD